MKKSINLDNLKLIKDSESAYVLGYLCWAGSRDNVYDRFAIQVLNTERSDLSTIKKVFNVSTKFKQAGNRSLRLTASSRGLVDVLEKWYVSRDSELGFPKVPTSFQKDFIRGLFERHGYVNTSKGRAKLTVPNTKFAQGLRKVLSRHGIKTSYAAEVRNDTVTHRVWVHTGSVSAFHDFMYTGVRRPHRRRRALRELSAINTTRQFRRAQRASVLLEWVRELHEEGDSLYKISSKLGVSMNTVRNYVDYLDL